MVRAEGPILGIADQDPRPANRFEGLEPCGLRKHGRDPGLEVLVANLFVGQGLVERHTLGERFCAELLRDEPFKALLTLGDLGKLFVSEFS